MTSRRATLRDVADRAGVSPATASRALADRDTAPGTRRRVREAADALGYSPHPVAQMLARRGGSRIVVAVRDASPRVLADPFVARATASVATTADAEGLGVALRHVPLDCTRSLAELAADRSVAAVVLAGHDAAALESLPAGLRKRTAAIGTGAPGVPHADVDSAAGIGALLHHLYGTGRRSIALIAGPPWLAAAEKPRKTYLAFVRETALPPHIVPGDFSAARGSAAARAILRRWPGTDAIVTVSDATALGALEALAARGVRVPGDIAVTGFDDIPLAAAVRPGLSTATHPVEEIAASAALAAIRGEGGGLFPSRAVIRGSA